MEIKTPLGNKNMKSLSFRDNNQHASPKLCSQIYLKIFCPPVNLFFIDRNITSIPRILKNNN